MKWLYLSALLALAGCGGSGETVAAPELIGAFSGPESAHDAVLGKAALVARGNRLQASLVEGDVTLIVADHSLAGEISGKNVHGVWQFSERPGGAFVLEVDLWIGDAVPYLSRHLELSRLPRTG